MCYWGVLAVLVLALCPVSAQVSALPSVSKPRTLISQSFRRGYAQSSAQPSVSEPEDLCTVEGVVVSAATGEGLKNIEVTAYLTEGNLQPQGALTDANGQFVISGLVAGRYTLSASGGGYPSQAYRSQRAHGAPDILALAPGSQEKNVIFRLLPGAVITGTVRDEDGVPVVNAHVQAVRMGTAGHRRQMLSSGTAQTNDLGQYRLFGLQPGEYLVYANLQRSLPANRKDEEVYLPTFYPDAADSEQANLVRVLAGDETSSIDIDLRKVQAVCVRGQVAVEGSAEAIRGSFIQLVPRVTDSAVLGDLIHGASIGEDHRHFEICGVPPGSYALVITWISRNRSLFGRTPVDVGAADVEGITITPGAGLQLAGRFRVDPGGNLNPGQLNLWLEPTESFGWPASANVKPDGSFVIENVADGTYQLRVGGFPEEYYVKWARAGGSDLLGSELTISQTQPLGLVEVALSLDGGRVDGVALKDRTPFPGAHVVLVPDPPNRGREDLYSDKATDPLGRFSLLGLPPGKFKLFAWEPRESLPFRDPEFLRDYETRGTPVNIEERKQQYVQLDLIPAEEGAAP